MKLSTLFFLGVGAVVTGAYLSSKEGEETKAKLKLVGDDLKPLLKDLIKKIETVIEKSKTIKSDELRANIEQKAEEVKKSLASINIDNTADKAIEIVKNTTKSVRKLWNEVINEPTQDAPPIVSTGKTKEIKLKSNKKTLKIDLAKTPKSKSKG